MPHEVMYSNVQASTPLLRNTAMSECSSCSTKIASAAPKP